MRTIALALVVLAGGSGAVLAQDRVTIPLRAGLTIVKSVAMTQGDAELIMRVERVDAEGVHIRWSGAITPKEGSTTSTDPLGGLLSGIVSAPEKSSSTKNPRAQDESVRLKGIRTVRRADLPAARHLYTYFTGRQPRVFPGSTTLGTSTAVLSDLKTKGEASFSCQCDPELFSGAGSLENMVSALTGAAGRDPDAGKLSGTLKRVGSGPATVRVLVNDVLTDLPVIQATGTLGEESAAFVFLDDAENPVVLRAQVGPNESQVVKLSFPDDSPATRIATALEKTGRADVYGIYFDIASATIRAESEPVLQEIAAALVANPGWKLDVEGHTDNVGADDENLDLSRRRAAAVKDALVARHGIAGARLTPAGFGESKPKASNDSVDGRARNRRVELVRR